MSQAGPNKESAATSRAAARPISPSRCRRAGCRVRRVRAQVKSRIAPPPTALWTNQLQATVQFMTVSRDSAAPALLAPGLGDHVVQAFQLFRGDLLAAQQAHDELV